MIQRIAIGDYLAAKEPSPIIDVRTPAEYESGHIPGAVNVPLFSNQERAEVGTIYKRVSPDKAYEKGYQLVTPKLQDFVDQANRIASKGKVTVYCWRGGMRSASFAEHIHENGIADVSVIEGGYKAFRQYALEAFSMPKELKILGGYTGSGKTYILHELKKRGEQVIDLEHIAHHKGSAFGSIGEPEQPSNEHFTNLLFWEWRQLDTAKPVWLEDESIHIGKVFIPEVLFTRMREARLYFLDIPREVRGHLLVDDYAQAPLEVLRDAVRRISKRLGGKNTTLALAALEEKDFYTTALITLNYYDKYYLKGMQRRDPGRVITISSDTIDPKLNADLLSAY